MLVRFAVLCDKCHTKSLEYEFWAVCYQCDSDICADCEVPGSNTEDEANQCLCKECDKAEKSYNEERRKESPSGKVLE